MKKIEVELPEELIKELAMSEKVQELLETHNTQDLEQELNLIIVEALKQYLKNKGYK